MMVKLLAFGIARDIAGGPEIRMSLPEGATAGALKAALEERYPRLQQLKSFLLAVNNEYAGDEVKITEADEVAIIPPVSGG